MVVALVYLFIQVAGSPCICTGSSNLFIIASVKLVSAKSHIATNSLRV